MALSLLRLSALTLTRVVVTRVVLTRVVLTCVVLPSVLPTSVDPTFAAAESPPGRGDLRVAVFGDFNGPYGATEYPRLVGRALDLIIDEWRPDLLLSPGDVIAGQSRALQAADLDAMWRAFDRDIAGPLRAAGIPYAVALGNHDGSGLRDRAGEYLFAVDREAAARYWSAVEHGESLAYVDRFEHPFNYSFTYGGAFVIVLDASSARLTDNQTEWVRQQLQGEEARRAGVRIAVGHLPLAPVSQGRETPGEYLSDGQELAKVWADEGLDLYISGHHAAFYVGTVAGLEALFTGGVGGKVLLAGDERARSTVTLVDLWLEPLHIRYTTVDLATLEAIAPDSLPARIVSDAGVVELSAWLSREGQILASMEVGGEVGVEDGAETSADASSED